MVAPLCLCPYEASGAVPLGPTLMPSARQDPLWSPSWCPDLAVSSGPFPHLPDTGGHPARVAPSSTLHTEARPPRTTSHHI